LDFVLNILAGLATSLIIYALSRYFVRAKWVDQWRTALVALVAVLMVIPAYAAFHLVWKMTSSGSPFPSGGWIYIGFAVWAQAILAFLLISLVRKVHAQNITEELQQLKQYGEPMDVYVTKPQYSRDIPIEIRPIPLADEGVKAPVILNWETFGDGLRFILKQIATLKPGFKPDLCIGINNGGVVMAAYLAGTIPRCDSIIASVKTEGADHDCVDPCLPKVSEGIKSILLADCEVKSGNSLLNVYNYISETYGSEVDIKIAIMVTCKVRENIGNMDDLHYKKKGAFTQELKYLPDFLAYIHSGDIEPPGEIR